MLLFREEQHSLGPLLIQWLKVLIDDWVWKLCNLIFATGKNLQWSLIFFNWNNREISLDSFRKRGKNLETIPIETFGSFSLKINKIYAGTYNVAIWGAFFDFLHWYNQGEIIILRFMRWKKRENNPSWFNRLPTFGKTQMKSF